MIAEGKTASKTGLVFRRVQSKSSAIEVYIEGSQHSLD